MSDSLEGKMDKFRECVASTLRMILFCCAGGILAVLGDTRGELILSVVLMLLAGNELFYIIMVIIDYRKETMPRSRSRKKQKKGNPVKKRVVSLLCFEAVACLVLCILYSNGVPVEGVWIPVAVFTAAILSLLV